MKRFVQDEDRRQATLLPECLDDYVTQDNPVRAIETFVDELDPRRRWLCRIVPEATGRPAYHPETLLKIYLYGYLNRIQSSCRLADVVTWNFRSEASFTPGAVRSVTISRSPANKAVFITERSGGVGKSVAGNWTAYRIAQ